MIILSIVGKLFKVAAALTVSKRGFFSVTSYFHTELYRVRHGLNHDLSLYRQANGVKIKEKVFCLHKQDSLQQIIDPKISSYNETLPGRAAPSGFLIQKVTLLRPSEEPVAE